MTRKFQFTGYLAATLMSGLLLFTACQKDTVNDDTTETDLESRMVVSDDAEANMLYEDAYITVIGTDDEVGIGTGIGIFGRTSGSGEIETYRGEGMDSTQRCFTVTRVPAAPGVFPKTVTIDFGSGCTGPDGRTRRGKIVTVYTGRLSVAGSEASTSFVNYFVDSTHVEGTMKVKNNSTGAVRVFTRTVTNGKLTRPSGNYIQWNATHTNTQTAGNATPFIPLDDEFDITGSATGQTYRNPRTLNWSHVISNPLHKKFTCRWISSGTITITRNSRTSTLDYGNGTCDNQATLTTGGQTFTITLR